MSPVVAIVGRPNVGKSTLFNRLSRAKGALTDDCPGITRDRLYASVFHKGLPFTLIDTGGYDEPGQDPLLERVRDQVKTAIQEAERVIFMVDGREGLLPADEEVARLLRRSRKKLYLAVNKVDGPEHEHLVHDFYRLGMEPVFSISAAHGYGLNLLLDEIARDLPKSEPELDIEGQIRIAVLGRPNAGKSSLINRILGSDRLLVSEVPGTTRDTVDARFTYREKQYLFIDTAGIRRKARVREKIDKFSMIKAIRSLDRCHVAAIILDATQGVTEQDARICGYAFDKGKAIVLVVNKWDLVKADDDMRYSLDNSIDRQLKFISFAPRINVSALTGERVMKLFDKLDLVYDQFSRRISTSSINSAIKKLIAVHTPPRIGRGHLKFFYATQTRIRPPSFVLFVNRPDMVHFSYERFIINQLRENFGLDHTPLKIKFQKRK